MKILMICLGNICRSPLAEGIMQHLVQQRGLDWTVDSAGTGSWHVGQCPDYRSVRVAKSYGVDISKQVCRQFNVSDFDTFDLLLAMDKNNLNDVLSLARNDLDKAKVRLLLNKQEVPDPYYDDNSFDPVYKLVEDGCKKIIEEYS
ncbi:low molecular weight protein-tyrosine-phosphatase [Mucilaginibacter aquatilis]|uniref:protein-tyrosine-phosphatase n=1 Tax=Mucilaginibacter aquatilis TaxID=1517760 RepID=A0A6I4I5U8_9SPHI|nr:low molecular weight protein-tyrosine-phosphatase [Mucilaginibacter aquatilis]MVN90451.1 low molecular weight phosphotyrosine protein phosphatase [Mucilaginibacter aquatilis]